MADFFFQEPEDVKPKTPAKMLKSENKRITTINVPFKNGAVILMNHPAPLTLYKHLSVTVLSGTVSINGWEMKKGASNKVFSSEKSGLLEIKTEGYESIWKKHTSAKRLEAELRSLFKSENICNRILQSFGNSTVAVYLQRVALPINVALTEYYCPQAFEFHLCKRSGTKDCLWFLDSEVSPLKFGEEEEKLAFEIAVLMRNAKMLDANFPRIMVCGPRNTGKSTLLQYLINKILSEHPSCCYLDTDPGQPEFTPPGVVSLTKVDEPLLGPPFFHQSRNSKMIFTGDISPSFVDLYCKSICTLMELYNTEYFKKALFVNTMGWIEGTGLQCLINTIAIVKPTVLIEIIPKDGTSMFDYRDYLPPDSQYFQISCKHDTDRKYFFPPKMMRELSLFSHLGGCQSPYLGVLPINEIRPYCISWKKIPLFVFPGGNILPSRIVEALNNSIVALCCVPKTCVLESGIPEFPKTLESDPENECLGYGFVRAVDETDHLLYIITPLKEHQMDRVNAVIKGNVMVPDSIILNQEIYNVPLPYTNVDEGLCTDEELMDISMLSLKYFSENEDESPESKPNIADIKLFPPLENYRQPINKRYKHKFLKKFMGKHK